ncbi:MAG: cupin domain-containing protein [Eggerthellaceae bacterium]|nr:cupin domain-containing protein [Eggerthellaceae bacterium]
MTQKDIDAMNMKAFVTHTDDHEWEEVFEGFRIKKLICEDTVGKSEYYAGIAQIDPGVSTPAWKANLACCTYIMDGQIWARLGRQRLELGYDASNYIPAGAPFSYEASGDKGLTFLFTYATNNDIGEHLVFEPVSEEEMKAFYQPNCPSNLMSPGMEAEGYRWACAGDADPYIMVEAAQGSRSLSFQAFYDEDRGCKEMWWGRTFLKSNCRYTPHYHEQSEFFFFLTGTGTMYAGDGIYQVRPGSMIYAPSNCLHGMVNDGIEPLCAIYCCNVETTGNAYIRYEVADVPLVVPSDRTNMLISDMA